MRRRSRFWAFIFSFVPGAGEMYMGLKKKGVEIMALSALIFFTAVFLGFGGLTIFCAILWFYSFFDTMDLSRLSPEELSKQKDSFLLDNDTINIDKLSSSIKSKNKIIGYICIVFGVVAIYQTFIRPFISEILYYLGFDYGIVYMFFNSIPSLVLGIAIIWVGIMIINHDNSKYQKDDIIEYKQTDKNNDTKLDTDEKIKEIFFNDDLNDSFDDENNLTENENEEKH